MTKQEADRIDHLYEEIIAWRREDSNRLLEFKDEIIAATSSAVEAHRMDCLVGRLDPMCKKLDWLYDNAQKRCAEASLRARRRKMWYATVGVICGLGGLATPYIVEALRALS